MKSFIKIFAILCNAAIFVALLYLALDDGHITLDLVELFVLFTLSLPLCIPLLINRSEAVITSVWGQIYRLVVVLANFGMLLFAIVQSIDESFRGWDTVFLLFIFAVCVLNICLIASKSRYLYKIRWVILVVLVCAGAYIAYENYWPQSCTIVIDLETCRFMTVKEVWSAYL